MVSLSTRQKIIFCEVGLIFIPRDLFIVLWLFPRRLKVLILSLDNVLTWASLHLFFLICPGVLWFDIWLTTAGILHLFIDIPLAWNTPFIFRHLVFRNYCISYSLSISKWIYKLMVYKNKPNNCVPTSPNGFSHHRYTLRTLLNPNQNVIPHGLCWSAVHLYRLVLTVLFYSRKPAVVV